MFVLADKMLFWWPVKVMMPSAKPDDAGRFIEQVCHIQFEVLEKDTSIAMQEAMKTATTAKDVADLEFEQIATVVRGWSDVVDAAGTSIPFDLEILREACQNIWFRDAIVRAYGEAMAGGAARLGN